MPFLHWETDRNRVRVGDMIERYTTGHNYRERNRFRKYIENSRQTWQAHCAKVGLPRYETSTETPSNQLANQSTFSTHYSDVSNLHANSVTKNVEDILWQKVRQVRWSLEGQGKKTKESKIFTGLRVDEWRRFQPSGSHLHLAQYLIDAARLYEAISTYQDCKLFEQYLFAHPPIHPRRSLDQAYIWRLKSTRRRDRDQVVYRYTKPCARHKYQPQPTNPAGLPSGLLGQMGNDCIGNKEGKHKLGWIDHDPHADGCFECWEDILRVSRCIMVDQLWMWVLDNNTVLTFFPQRYGLGKKKDQSGVHSIIRERVSGPKAVPISSVWDLAVIILEASFDSFFDRTITADRRPQVLDIFGESIGNVVRF